MFLDADTLMIQNSDELFDRDEFSAAPDAGWPDCFNSGVFVFRPNLNTFRVGIIDYTKVSNRCMKLFHFLGPGETCNESRFL